MIKTALLAIDLSPSAEPLLLCMSDLVQWGVQRLVLVHVVRVGYAQGPGYHALEELTDWLERSAEPLRKGGLQVEVSVRAAGVVADEILVAAAEFQSDMLAVGSRSHNLTARIFLGSVARDLVRKTTLPLLLVRIEPDAKATEAHCRLVCSDTLRHVLLATDLSKHATAAEVIAVALARRAKQIDCLSVVTPEALDAMPAWPLMVRAALEDLLRRIEAAGGRGAVLVTEGEPSAEIARVAAAHDCSLIVVGKHGQNWVKDMIIGRSAGHLCERAGLPVLLVPLVDKAHAL
jgi:nucleotide-binding universal stress UspA family protein